MVEYINPQFYCHFFAADENFKKDSLEFSLIAINNQIKLSGSLLEV